MDKQTILVVDDELVGRQLLNAVLISDGYQVLLAENGTKAIEVAEKYLPDLILMDVMMPDMDGFTTIKKIKEIDTLLHTPIILVTALDDRDNRIKGLESGATDYITKPFDRIEVLAKIKNLAKKSVVINSQKSNNTQFKDSEQKFKFLINEILSTSPTADPNFINTTFFSSNSIESYTGKYALNNTAGAYYYLFGSDQPEEEDRFQIALVNTWLNQLVKEGSDYNSACKNVSKKIQSNHFFKQKQWWFIQICSTKEESLLIKGFNLNLVGFSSKNGSTNNLLSDVEELNASAMNYAICSFKENPECEKYHRLQKEIAQFAADNKTNDIEASIKNYFTNEDENRAFIVGIQIKR
jgi:CheY-like chemotaxis protein